VTQSIVPTIPRPTESQPNVRQLGIQPLERGLLPGPDQGGLQLLGELQRVGRQALPRFVAAQRLLESFDCVLSNHLQHAETGHAGHHTEAANE
jgi:hypothetical protein